MSDKVVVFKLFWLRQASYSELAISIFIFWLAQLCLLTFQQFHFIWRLYSIPPRSESVFIFSHLGKSPFPSTISVLQHYCPHRLEEQKRIIKLMTISLNGCLWKDDCNACHVSFQLLFFFFLALKRSYQSLLGSVNIKYCQLILAELWHRRRLSWD